MSALDTLDRSGSVTSVNAPPVTALDRTYTAWRVSSRNEGQALEITAATLAEAIAATVVYCAHKDVFLVREHDPLRDETTVHHFAVKRSSKARYVYSDHQTRAVHDFYAEPLFALRVDAFAPVEPWRWTPGADAGGYKVAGVVEAGL